MPFTAHIRNTDKIAQTVGEHCRDTAILAERFLEDINLGKVGRLVGLLHDAGKLTQVFDDYINARNNLTRVALIIVLQVRNILLSFAVTAKSNAKKP